jgi:hydrogenase maturation protease
MPNANKVLILGLGNDLLTDDAVGLHVARAAGARLAGERGVVVRETMEMGLALLDEIVGFDGLVLVDSIQTGQAPVGHIHEFNMAALAGRRISTPHFLGVAETLALGRRLGLAMPGNVWIIAIEVADPFTLATQMTSGVEHAVDAAAGRVIERAHGFMMQPSFAPALTA